MSPTLTRAPEAEQHYLRDAIAARNEIRCALADAKQVFLFSDFDGTLSPIVDIPSAATIDPEIRMVLARFCLEPGAVVSVLSGRSIGDVRARVGLPLIYAGDHGLDIIGPDFAYSAPGAEIMRQELPGLCNELRERLHDIPGALVECKRFTASIHYRLVPPEQIPVLTQTVEGFVNPERFDLRQGKCVIEVRPRLNWSKGKAAQWVLNRFHGCASQAICIGDDVTDEDMFRQLPMAINVKVGFGGEDSNAQYWVPQSEVSQLLLTILDVVRSKRQGR